MGVKGNPQEAAEMIAAMEAEIARLQAQVVTLAKLGDFSGLRPNSETFKMVVEIKRAGEYR